MRRWFIECVTLVVFLATPMFVVAQSRETPVRYEELHAGLEADLDRFDLLLASQWDGSSYPVQFSAQLIPADSHRGQELFAPFSYFNLLAYLDRLVDLGVRAAVINISYPILFPEYHRSTEEYLAYLYLYKQIANDVRRRGLKLIVKSQALFPYGPYGNPAIAAFYRRIKSLDEYKRGRLYVARTIAQELRPDYLSIQMEPDTEAILTGQPVDSPEGSIELINFILTGLQRAGVGAISIGAGIGTWHQNYLRHVHAIAGQTAVDYIDVHVYPVNYDYLERILSIADIAKLYGKQVAISEAWLYKISDREVPYAPLLSSDVMSRDPFSFWAPLDRRFIKTMVGIANFKQLVFMCPTWSNYFFAYLDYEGTKFLPVQELIGLSALESAWAVISGALTRTGLTYSLLIR